MKMSKEYPFPVRLFQQLIFSAMKEFGLNTISAKIMSLLKSEAHELTMEDLSIKTGYSAASISTNIKFLEQFNLIFIRKQAGSKKKYISAQKDYLHVIYAKIKQVFETESEQLKEDFPKIITAMKEHVHKLKNKKEYSHAKDQLDCILNYYKQTKIISKIHEHMIKGLEQAIRELKK